jgi:hypothetical protein
MTAEPDEERRHLEDLKQRHARNVWHLERQASQFGGISSAPLEIANKLYDAQQELAAVQARLVQLDARVEALTAFDDLTLEQRAFIIGVLDSEEKDDYHSAFYGVTSHGEGWRLWLEKRCGGSQKVFRGIDPLDLEFLQRLGYIVFTFGNKGASCQGKFLQKAYQEYRRWKASREGRY